MLDSEKENEVLASAAEIDALADAIEAAGDDEGAYYDELAYAADLEHLSKACGGLVS